jgi:autotransporter-associated beta strand protein
MERGVDRWQAPKGTSNKRWLALLASALVIGTSGSALAAITTNVWDGGGIGNLWMTGKNWATDMAPSAGDDVQFPAGAMQTTNFNNFANLTAFNSIQIQASGYQLQGESIALGGGIVGSQASGDSDIVISLELTASQTFEVTNAGAMLTYFNIAQENHTLTFDGAGVHLVMGVIQDNLFGGPGGGPVVKNGSGTVRLQGVAQYSGLTTINAGTWLVNNSQSPGSINVLGGLFGGNGAIGGTLAALTVTGGAFNPGDGGPGILTSFDDVTFGPGAQFQVEINGTTAGTGGYDQLKSVVGTIDLGNVPLVVTLGFEPMIGDTFQIIDRMFGSPVSGTFAGLPEGAKLTVGEFAFAISYVGGDGNDVVLTAVPLAPPRPVPALDDRGRIIAALALFVLGVFSVRRLRANVSR